MAVIEGGTSGALQEVGVPTAGNIGSNLSASVNLKALPYGSLGHYAVSVRFALVAAQAANSRLFASSRAKPASASTMAGFAGW